MHRTSSRKASYSSSLTDRYQTTVPSPVREALGLAKRDKIEYFIESNGEVRISKAVEPEHDSDPVIHSFLEFLSVDIKNNPQRLQLLSHDLYGRAQELVGNLELDIDAPLPEEDE